jgi:hypothetical protein
MCGEEAIPKSFKKDYYWKSVFEAINPSQHETQTFDLCAQCCFIIAEIINARNNQTIIMKKNLREIFDNLFEPEKTGIYEYLEEVIKSIVNKSEPRSNLNPPIYAPTLPPIAYGK